MPPAYLSFELVDKVKYYLGMKRALRIAETANRETGRSGVAEVRRFNRFYTGQIGLLDEGLLRSPFSLAEVRVLYELAHREQLSAVELCKELGLDAGYLSRMLRGFSRQGLVRQTRSKEDGRRSVLSLTPKGQRVFAPLDARSNEDVKAMLDRISHPQQQRLLGAMRDIAGILGSTQHRSGAYILRSHRPGDMGWVVHRHGVLYELEQGYDERFEALVAGIVAQFVENFDPKRERCWIAERESERLGCVFLVKKSKTVAKLRMLLVEPSARGMGLGKRLVDECVAFAREAGYKRITLWTQSDLHSARHLYEQVGFKLAQKKKHASWSRKDLMAEIWDLKL